jgi:integrase/recombinase XerD
VPLFQGSVPLEWENTIVGKVQKERAVLLGASLWADLMALKAVTLGPDVFVSRGNGRGSNKHISPSQVQHIVREAAIRAGINRPVSPHWLPYAHASIALDCGAPISLVRDTLGHGSASVTDKYGHAKPEHSSSEYL